MRLVGRVILVCLGLTFAISSGTLVLLLAPVFDPVMAEFAARVAMSGMEAFIGALAGADDPAPLLGQAFDGVRGLSTSLLIAPPLVVALAGEVMGWRSLAWYAGATGMLTGAVPWLLRSAPRPPMAEEMHITLALFVTGAAAGMVYWLIAGQGAGSRPPDTGPARPARPARSAGPAGPAGPARPARPDPD